MPTVICPRRRTLLAIFGLWKTLLLCIAVCSPGPGYDSSTSLLWLPGPNGLPSRAGSSTGGLPWMGRLVRWDAIYFIKIAERGYRFEQEWAFGAGFANAVALISRASETIRASSSQPPWGRHIVVAVALANAAHLLSVLVLYRLTRTVFGPGPGRDSTAFIAATLHIFSPAGLFLSVPYGESLFSMLSYFGYLTYAKSLEDDARRLWLWRDSLVMMSGALFGLATAVRSNGLLNGMLFLYDALVALTQTADGVSPASLSRLISLAVAGIMVALGTILPQWVAYREFCVIDVPPSRPWCTGLHPSIYAWVQQRYWDVGFLRYWTLSNLPLFLIAGPMLAILVASSIWAIRGPSPEGSKNTPKQDRVDDKSLAHTPPATSPPLHDLAQRCLLRFALPQLILTVLAVAIYHVQIINRISSGYVIWYWWLARLISQDTPLNLAGSRWKAGRPIVRWMVIYSLLQAGLFASFLPPA